MKILLVGEYSNLHNSLKAGLMALSHEVTLLGPGDGFKDFPVDLDVRGRFFQDFFVPNALRQLLHKLSGTDLAVLETFFRASKMISNLPDYDIVQLINEYPFKTPYYFERKLIKKLRAKAKKLIVLACGDDFLYLKNIHKLPHHPMTLLKGKVDFKFSEVYLTKAHARFHKYVYGLKDQIISSDLDYHTIYKDLGLPDYFGMIPNPIQLEKFEVQKLTTEDTIVIFHGVNRINYYKKGNDLFDLALSQIKKEFGDRVEILRVESLPYTTYITQYGSAHILLDQTYALDQGYNALEAMAQGKVVFTGAGAEFCDYYKVDLNSRAIHTIPDVEKIVYDLTGLINDRERLRKISKNARLFIDKHHRAKEVAERYSAVYQANLNL